MGSQFFTLGDNPQASADCLRAALNHPEHRFGVVVVNAHGISSTYGVALAGQTVWQGNGVDLSQTDLIILASCSVGRLNDKGVDDIEGLCAELAANRGRTVIAARWPIADTETATLVAEIVDQYLQICKELGSDKPLPLFARARAFARARRKLLNDNKISLHLASAFELYGLG